MEQAIDCKRKSTPYCELQTLGDLANYTTCSEIMCQKRTRPQHSALLIELMTGDAQFEVGLVKAASLTTTKAW